MKLALGTAQFGMAYGIANRLGKVSADEVGAVLRLARSAGIDTLDTAVAYGDSEHRLGEMGVTDWKVISKLPAVPDACSDISAWVDGSVRGSLGRLGVSSLYGLLLHRPVQLLQPRGGLLYRALLHVRAVGLVEKIGVSIYDTAELDSLSPALEFDLVQAPFNVLDRRLQECGWLERLVAQGTEVHARSVFLQGLLLVPKESRPRQFDRWAALWADYDRWLSESALTPLQACLRYALSIPGIGRVVLGVDSVTQLAANLEAAKGPAPEIPACLATHDTELLNPARWATPG